MICDILDASNIICRIDGLIGRVKKGGRAHRFHIDRRCGMVGIEVERMLATYGVDIFGRGFRSGSGDRPPTLYFSVGGRQTRWAEYLLLHKGLPVVSRPVDEKSAARALELRRRGEAMPTPWNSKSLPPDAAERWASAATQRETTERGPKPNRRRRKRQSDDPMDRVLSVLDWMS